MSTVAVKKYINSVYKKAMAKDLKQMRLMLLVITMLICGAWH